MMGDICLGDRVYLTARGNVAQPPVGSGGYVIAVTRAGDEAETVTVRWDDGSQSVVTRWNAVLNVAP